MEGMIAGMNFCAFCNCTIKETFFSQSFCSNLYSEKNSIFFLTPNFVNQYIHIYKFFFGKILSIYIYIYFCNLMWSSLSLSLSLSHTHTHSFETTNYYGVTGGNNYYA